MIMYDNDNLTVVQSRHSETNNVFINIAGNGLSTNPHQAITWTNADSWSMRPSTTWMKKIIHVWKINKSLNQIKDQFHSRKCFWKCHLQHGGVYFCLNHNVLKKGSVFYLGSPCATPSHVYFMWSSTPATKTTSKLALLAHWVLSAVDKGPFSVSCSE